MFIVYFVLFVIFNGKMTTEIACFGVGFAALLYAFSCKYLGYSIRKDLRLVRGAFAGIRYLIMLMIEILKANLQVIRMILTPGFEPKPQLVQFKSGLNDEGHRVALADSITLTPGTITCELDGDLFTVHCLDRVQMEGLEENCFLTALRKMEEKSAGQMPEPDDGLVENAETETPWPDDGLPENAESETPWPEEEMPSREVDEPELSPDTELPDLSEEMSVSWMPDEDTGTAEDGQEDGQ